MRLKIITVATVILLMVAMAVPVYADTVIPAPPSDVSQYWVILSHPLHDFWCLSSSNPITVTTDETIIIVDGYRYHKYVNNHWHLVTSSGDISYHNLYDIYASNHDIAYEDGSGFFFLRPKVSRLYPTMKKTDFGTILRNFSAGLIPIAGLIVLAIALTKGWRFLRGQLMT